MNLYETTQLVITRFDSNILVNTISFVKTQDIDLNKENIYPLVNIDYISSQIGEARIPHKYLISILNQRDIDNVFNNDKIFPDNYIDNINEAHTIATLFINQIRGVVNDEVEIISISDVVVLNLTSNNLLDGVRFEIVIEVDNDVPC